jgi:hypothetical protein
MQNFKIFTESIADIKFLKDYIEEIFKISLPTDSFIPLGGKTGYKKGGSINALIKKNIENEGETILIVDADNDFSKKTNEVALDFASYNIPIHLFRFPNNTTDGNLEDILSEIAVHKELMNCFLDYEKCVKAYPKKLNHSRIYSYLDMLLLNNSKDEHGKDLRLEADRNYRNTNHWDLHHVFLKPLKVFLTPFFE